MLFELGYALLHQHRMISYNIIGLSEVVLVLYHFPLRGSIKFCICT
jgi:hypothetical protein